ncbi:MAG: type I methionyl aminopeptidase [Planctomycetes bacterium]|nr:type I methionyl aminopeptidase [Planctomycetota bacterium]
MIKRKSPRELDLMRVAGRVVAEALAYGVSLAKPGVTTEEIDRAIEGFIRGRQCAPTFKGYRGYPKTICASVNEEVVHGIPGARKLAEGDILSIDMGATYKNYIGDAALTIPIGQISKKADRLIRVTKTCLELAIKRVVPGGRLSDVSEAVQRFAEAQGYGVVRKYAGHGVGSALHEDPQVPNYVTEPRDENEVILKPGMVIAIEPMLNEGTYDVEVLKDGWTVVTKDRRLSAHFEHTVAVTESGNEIFTALPA